MVEKSPFEYEVDGFSDKGNNPKKKSDGFFKNFEGKKKGDVL